MARTISDEQIRLEIIVNGNPAQKQLLALEKSTRKVNKETKALKIERKKLETQGKKGSKEWVALNNTIKKNTTVLANNKAKMKILQDQIGLTGLSVSQLKKKAALLRMQLMHTMPDGAADKKYRAELKATQARLTQLSFKAKQTKLSLSSVANGFNKYAALGASVIATTTGIVLGLQHMLDYNGKLADAQSDVQKTTGLTKTEVDELTKSFGILNTRTSRMELLKIAEEGGRIGIAKNEIQDFVRVMNKANVALGDSFQGGPEEVASKLGKLKLLFKETKNIGVEDAYESIGSAINELGANGVATETNIATFATRIGSLSDALKPTIQDALGLGAAFEESGIKAEISGRAYSIFLGQAAVKTSEFAKVMGISKEEVEELIDSNPTEFFLQFAEKLSETSKGGVDTAKTLQKLGLSADGVKKIVGAAGNNVGRFRELLDLSNKSMIEGTSLTKEYDIKNNNLAATLSKVKKRLMGAFSSETVVSGLTSLVTWFGKLIGAVKDVNKEFAIQTKLTFESATNNRRLANESQHLLNKYQELTKDGLEPTKKQKKQLDTITLQLKDRLGESVIAIDKETGSYKLNTEAVKEQIKMKRLTADEEAMMLVSRAEGAKQESEEITETLVGLQERYEARKQLADQARTNFKETEIYRSKTQKARLSAIANLPEVEKEKQAFLALAKAKGDIVKQDLRREDILKKLKELNFSQTDVDNYFKETTPEEGAEKFVGNTKFIFKNGNWVAVPPKKNTPGGGDEDEMTPEDKAIANSKEKLAEFIDNWHLDQDIQQILRDEEKLEKEAAKEAAAIEMKYLKMAEEAGFSNAFQAGLEEIKNQEIQEVKDKWAAIRLKKKKEEDKKYAKLDAAQKKKLIAAEEKLEQAKRNVLESGLQFLGNVFNRKSALYKILFGIEKAMAINNVLVDTKKANAQITSNLAIANMKAVAAAPLTGGLPFTAYNSAIAAKSTMTNNLNAGVQIAGILGTVLAGFEEGFYPVQREQDGKMFNAQFGGKTQSGIVNKPTVFLAGENGPELIVDSKAFRQINPDIRNSFQREIARVKGFEVGYYPQPIKTTDVTLEGTDVPIEETNNSNEAMVLALNRATAIFEKIEKDGIIAYLSNDLKTAKRVQDSISDYNRLRNKSIR